MNWFYRVIIIRPYALVLAGCLIFYAASGRSSSMTREPLFISGDYSQKKFADEKRPMEELNAQLKVHLQNRDLTSSASDAEKVIKLLKTGNAVNNDAHSTACYLLGIYYLLTNNFGEAIRFLEISASNKEQRKEFDSQYAKTIYNIGVAYNRIGDYLSQEQYSEKSLAIEKELYGSTSPLLIKTYASLAIANIELHDYEQALDNSNKALVLADNNPDSTEISDLASIYNNLGVLYMWKADYSKAKVYLEKSESLHLKNKFLIDESYFNILNSLAIAYGNLGLADKSKEYYKKGIDLAISDNSSSAYNFINSYAIELGRSGRQQEGEKLLYNALIRAKAGSGKTSQLYYSVMHFYAEYLSEMGIDNAKALKFFKLCVDYIGKNNRNLSLRDPVYMGYSRLLAENGDLNDALEVIQSLLLPVDNHEPHNESKAGLFPNPSPGSLKADKISLRILRLKYEILWKMYKKTQDIKILEAASSTSKLIVAVLEKVRINISEEDSRLILGDRYKDSYLNAIRDFNLLYQLTGDSGYLENEFEFSEKSKVAGLLTATRELNAAQFNIPDDLSELEKRLKRDLTYRSARIDEEMAKENPDAFLISTWKESILKSSAIRDSLIAVFEKRYPGYYAFKYNSDVLKMDAIPGVAGRNVNYISYVSSDTTLYIFIVNRKNHRLLSIPIDSSLFADIRQFRSLLGMPSPSANAREAFENFRRTGYRLYKKIIEPVRPYLISNKLLISPDNILSYIPFETIPTSLSSDENILYNKLHYLMNDFDISYTYSVTFLAESMKRASRFSNKLIAFAPSYSEPVDLGTVLKNRQKVNGLLPDLPYARQEAEYVSSITGGQLYENDAARETVFKNESGKYDIIHLAMHTVLNDKSPMYSTLIFSSENDTINDRYLKTYEIYSIPLRAKMVVLSSCNSGAGLLYSGEGILSLARGFMYSGSKSVVMAMWEIEDKSGTDIVKGFYENLKKGYSKSSALRRARIHYLKQADQLRSHPYFWSSLVIYGNNSPLYYSRYWLAIPFLACAAAVVFLVFYLRRRRYS
jgi:CHAT domain-containing protein/tetratricopeptide (TPR) repeat protein